MKFSTRAVAFLDILGFKELICKVEKKDPFSVKQFNALLKILKDHARYDNSAVLAPKEVHPKYLFISDSLIISAPKQHLNYRGLAIVSMKAIALAHKLLEMGLLLRGGIAVGSVCHTKSNIFGSGYVRAYQTEQVARHPCILLSDEAASEASTLSNLYPDMWKQESGKTIVRTFNPDYLNPPSRIWEDPFNGYSNYIVDNLKKMRPGCPARAKWEWTAEFFNNEVRRCGVNVPTIDNFPFPK